VVVAFVGLASSAPLAYAVADQSGDELRSRAVELGARLDPEDTTTAAEQLTTGGGALMMAVVVLGGALAVGVFAARWYLSRRYVAGVMAGRRPRSVALAMSILFWSILGIAAAGIVAVQLAIETPAGPTSDPFVDQPLAMLLMPAGVGLAAAFSWWRHRRRWELGPLLAAGIAYQEPDPGGDEGGIAQGVWAFTRAAAIESGFVVAFYFQALIDGESPSFGDAVSTWILNVAFLPGVIAGLFVLILAVMPGTRWTVRAVLARRTNLAALVLVVGGYFGSSLGEQGSGTYVALGTLMLLGGFIASVTGLGIQDLGPQPWLGLLFLVFVFSYSFASADGSFAAPAGVFAWLVTVVIAALTMREGYHHWRASFRRVRLSPAEAPTA
jgi:MFS family permease